MTDDLFAPSTPVSLQPATTNQSKRPGPPLRACLVCGATNRLWDEQANKYACGSNPDLHADRLHTPNIWVGKVAPEEYR